MDKKSRFFEKYKKLETILNIEINSSEAISIGEKFDQAISKDKRLKQYRTKNGKIIRRKSKPICNIPNQVQ
jgi:hypothetical protein